MEPEEKTRFSLLENGLDFILSALSFLEDQPSDRDWKYGLINLAAGIEFVLKERIRQENWELLFCN